MSLSEIDDQTNLYWRMHNNNVQLHTERERTPHEPRKLESDLIQLKEEHEDLKHRFEKLKKQLELWNQVSQGSCSSQLSKQKQELLLKENEHLKAQLVHIVTDKQQLQKTTDQLREKINDLKYNNCELKNLNDKQSSLQQKQVNMLRRDIKERELMLREVNQHDKEQKKLLKESEERERKMMKDRDSLEKKLESCSKIVKQMEAYYMSELKVKDDAIKLKEKQISKLRAEIQEVKAAKETVKDGLDQLSRQDSKQWELKLEQQQQKYEKQVAELREKIKFLISKLQGNSTLTTPQCQDPTSLPLQIKQFSNGGISQRMLSSQSLSSSVKESLGRRTTLKTPVKYINQRNQQPTDKPNLHL